MGVTGIPITILSLSFTADEGNEQRGNGEKEKPFLVIIKDGTVSVDAENTDLSKIVKTRGEKTTPPFTIVHSRHATSRSDFHTRTGRILILTPF